MDRPSVVPLARCSCSFLHYLIQRNFFITVEVHSRKEGVGAVPQPHKHEAFRDSLLQLHQLQLEEQHRTPGNPSSCRHACKSIQRNGGLTRARLTTHLRFHRVPSAAGRSPLCSHPHTSHSNPSPDLRSPCWLQELSGRVSQTGL